MDDLINRIKGMSTVHQLLSNSNWSPLPLSELARQLICTALQTLPPDRRVMVNISDPGSVVVTPKEAQNLAIVINELATNVVKYATPAKKITQITVRISKKFSKETILIEFRDGGPGFPASVLRSEYRNVGIYLIENIVRHTLRGKITLHNNKGAVVIIEFVKETE
jgi:two-component sensor histidine kinase